MAQHFLLTSKARSLSSIKIARLSDAEAFSMLCDIRWRGEKNVVCPKWGVKHKPILSLLASNGDASIVSILLALPLAQFLLTISYHFKPIYLRLPYSLMR